MPFKSPRRSGLPGIYVVLLAGLMLMGCGGIGTDEGEVSLPCLPNHNCGDRGTSPARATWADTWEGEADVIRYRDGAAVDTARQRAIAMSIHFGYRELLDRIAFDRAERPARSIGKEPKVVTTDSLYVVVESDARATTFALYLSDEERIEGRVVVAEQEGGEMRRRWEINAQR